MNKTQFRKHMKSLTIPEGFSSEFQEKDLGGDVTHHSMYVGKPGEITIYFNADGTGSTTFKTAEGWWKSFDRTGVEPSFYHRPMYKGHEVPSLNEILAEQLKRIKERKKYYSTAIKIPGLPGGWTVAPEGVEKLKAQIRKDGHITFTPSGFGTGYNVTRMPQWGLRHGEVRAKKDLETFLDCAPLYIQPMDCD